MSRFQVGRIIEGAHILIDSFVILIGMFLLQSILLVKMYYPCTSTRSVMHSTDQGEAEAGVFAGKLILAFLIIKHCFAFHFCKGHAIGGGGRTEPKAALSKSEVKMTTETMRQLPRKEELRWFDI